MRRVITLILVVLCCSCTPLSHEGQEGTLRIGISPASPPLAYTEDSGKLSGLEVEFAYGLATFLNLKPRLIELKWSEQLDALANGRTDIIMSGMSVTEPRQYLVNFSNSYMVAGQVPLIRVQDRGRYTAGVQDLLSPPLKVGTVKGTTGDLLIQKLRARGSRVVFVTPEKGVQALLAGEIDTLVYDLPMNLHYAALYASNGITTGAVPLTVEHLAWAMRKDDQILQQGANSYLEHLDSSGQLLPMIQRWVPGYQPPDAHLDPQITTTK